MKYFYDEKDLRYTSSGELGCMLDKDSIILGYVEDEMNKTTQTEDYIVFNENPKWLVLQLTIGNEGTEENCFIHREDLAFQLLLRNRKITSVPFGHVATALFPQGYVLK